MRAGLLTTAPRTWALGSWVDVGWIGVGVGLAGGCDVAIGSSAGLFSGMAARMATGSASVAAALGTGVGRESAALPCCPAAGVASPGMSAGPSPTKG